MSDLGQLLRKARIENKISLEDLQETTKIRKRYLEAIEEGNYKVLPGNFYVRAFIKSYAEAVGLDPGELLNMYQNVIPASEPEHIEPIRAKRTGRNTERISRMASSVMVISFFVLIIGIVYYFVVGNYKSGVNSADNNLPKQMTDKVQPTAPAAPGANTNGALNQTAPQSVPVQPAAPPAPKAEVKLVRSERGTDYYAVTQSDKINIEVKITGDACWLQIDELVPGRKMIEQGTFQKDTVKTWTLASGAYMNFGKANAVELTVNGEPIVVGDAANPKRIQIEFQKQ